MVFQVHTQEGIRITFGNKNDLEQVEKTDQGIHYKKRLQGFMNFIGTDPVGYKFKPVENKKAHDPETDAEAGEDSII